MAVIDLYTEGAKCSKIFSILNQMVMDASLKLVAASGKKGQDLKRKKKTDFSYLGSFVSYCIYVFSVRGVCLCDTAHMWRS